MPAHFRGAIDATLRAFPHTPGVVVAVHRADLGFAVSAHGRETACGEPSCEEAPMPADGVFEIGSVTKNLRWILLHLLAEEGRLRLDQPVNDFVPAPWLPGVTVGDLMHHTSGMIDILDAPAFVQVMQDLTRVFSRDDSIAFLTSAHGTLSSGGTFAHGRIDGFRVGGDFHYSNFGPVVAGAIAEAVTCRAVRELVKEKILDRLQLTSTSHVFHDPRPARVVQGYSAPGEPNTRVLDYADTAAVSTLIDGLVYSTACDLVHLAHEEFADTGFLRPETRIAMTTDVLDAGGGTEAGLGVIRYGVAPDFWGHLGSGIHSHSSLLMHRPADGLSVVVLANIDATTDNWQTHLTILDALAEP